ncbi:MAG: RNA polymerase sigma-70 factor [Candidatus Limnocylindrales bacterium]
MSISRTPADSGELDGVYATLRPLLLSIAYEMVGAVGEAEDIVQEAFLRFHREAAKGTQIESPKAWLSTVTTRLAINHVRSARVRRETYVGTWLPEPLVTDAAPDVARHVETTEALSMAFLVLLERLGPVERAVFLLRDVFDFGFDEIADIVGKSEDNCRQIAVRARRHIQDRKPRFEASRERREALARRFFEAVGAGTTDRLVDLLAADVVLYTDGGGKGPAFPQPIYGQERVTRLFSHYRPAALGAVAQRFAEINGQPGVVFFDGQSRAVGVIALDVAGGQIVAVRTITNPEKLRHLDEGRIRPRVD